MIFVLLILLVVSCGPQRPTQYPINTDGYCDGGTFYAKDTPPAGHRVSNPDKYPYDVENSTAALMHTIYDYDIKEIEFDIRTTLDNVLVVIHDGNTCRTGKEKVSVSQTKYEDLPELKDGSKIPTLAEFYNIISNANQQARVTVVLDLKSLTETSIPYYINYALKFKAKYKVRLNMSKYFPENNLELLCEQLASNDLKINYYGGEEACK